MTIKDLKKALDKKVPTVTETFEQIINTVEKVNQQEVNKTDYREKFEEQQQVILDFIDDYIMSGDDNFHRKEIPNFKSNDEKNKWFKKVLLISKF